jgi:hypothetical protein
MKDEQPVQAIEATLSPQSIYCPHLPLAVYREIVAHLRQVTGVEVELLPQQSAKFDYLQSQVGGLRIRYTAAADRASSQRVEQILAYYGDRYGKWQAVEEATEP